MRWPLLVVVGIALAGCGAAYGPADEPLIAEMRNSIVRPPVAGYLLERRFAAAEAITLAPSLQVRVLSRRETGDPDRIQVRIQIQGDLQVTMLPEPDLRPLQRLAVDADEAARAKALADIRKAQAEAARRIPPERRIQMAAVARQVTLQVRREGTDWRIVLPADLADGRQRD